jgi:hypothetical protein
MRHQIQNVRIDENNICRVNNEMCMNNAKYTCCFCQIMSGSQKFPIMFVPGLTISKPQPDQIDKKIIIQLLPLQEEVKVAPISEDYLDKSNFVKHLSIAVTHSHSDNWRPHTHYKVIDIFSGSCCSLCGFPIVGSVLCDQCNELELYDS